MSQQQMVLIENKFKDLTNEQIVNNFIKIFNDNYSDIENYENYGLMFFNKLSNTKSYDKNENYELLKLCSTKLIMFKFDEIKETPKYKLKILENYLLELVQCNISYNLVSDNLHLILLFIILQYNSTIIKIFTKCKYTNFLIIYKYLDEIQYLNNQNKQEICIISCKNYDDRIFKLCINNLKIIPKDERFFINLSSRPEKYFFKRLKYIKKYINNDIKQLLFNSINNIKFSENILNMFFKYYYDFVLDEDSLNKLVQTLFSVSDLSIYKKREIVSHILNYLKTSKEKNQFNLFCIYYGNIIINLKYLDFDSLSTTLFFSMYNKLRQSFNIKTKEDSYSFNIIIKKAIESNNFNTFLKKQYSYSYGYGYGITSNNSVYGYLGDKKILYMLPYIKETCDNTHCLVNFLYIKLKMFIRKIRMNKIIQRDIQFKPVLFELMNYHTSKINTYSMKEMDIKLNKVPPHLMFPGEIELLKNFIIKEKADGELVYKLPPNIEPPFNINYDIKAEYIEELDLYLLFDCNINMNIIDKYNFLRDKHYITYGKSINIVNSMKQLVDLINYERTLFENFMNKDYDTCRWYPKAAWQIIKMDKLFINDMYDFINETSIYKDTILNNNYYKNDGFIISQFDDLKEIKIKPRSLMTIDLKYDGNNFIDRDNNIYNIKVDKYIKLQKGIYRCYPNSNNFIAKEIRYDKNKPNPYDVVNNIINLSKITYCIKNSIYYHNVNYKHNKLWGQIVNDNMSNLINVNNFMYKNQNILDLGCGKSKVLKLKMNYTDYTGYDYDIYVLLKNMKTLKNNNNIHFNYIDLSGEWDKTHDKFYDVKFNKYMNIYAINSLMHFNTEQFWEQINKVSQKGTRFIFNLLQVNTYKDIEWINNNSYIKQNKNQIELYFENVHSEPLIEKYITIKDVKKYLEQYNFNIIYTYKSSNNNITDLYDWYVCEKLA